MPGGNDVEPQHNNRHGNQRKRKVHQREQHLLNREYPAVNFDLLEQRRSHNDGRKRLTRGLGHNRKRNVADDQIQRVQLGRNGTVAALSKDRGKNNRHHDHHKKRVKNGPRNTQNATAVLNLKVLSNKVLKDKLVFFDIVLSVRGRLSLRYLTL